MRRPLIVLALGAVAATPAAAQPPPTAPLVLRLPATPRTTALGNAWVAGRDQDVLFYNPAQLIGARTGLDVSLTRFGRHGSSLALGSVYAAGKLSLTLGWGVHAVSFAADTAASYPFAPDALIASGPSTASSSMFAVGGAILYKGFRLGATGKFVADRTGGAPIAGAPSAATALVADLGVARNLFGGVAAFSAQNLGPRTLGGDGGGAVMPRQMLMGWSTSRAVRALDVGVFGQVLVREGWTAPAAGVEIGYSWIEGCVVALRAGIRRQETPAERPYAFGGALTIDRVSVEYTVQFFDADMFGHGVTLRWR